MYTLDVLSSTCMGYVVIRTVISNKKYPNFRIQVFFWTASIIPKQYFYSKLTFTNN